MQVLVGTDGAHIDARVVGAGTGATIALHGFPFSREIWNAHAQALGAGRRAIFPDLRGMGGSSVTDGPYLMEALAADVAATLDALGVERAAVVGHSLGGYVALAFARMFAERVERLALVCSRLSADTRDQAVARLDLAERVEREHSIEPVVESYLPRLFAERTVRGDPSTVARAYEIARATNPLGAAAMLRGMALRDAADDIAGDLAMPVLLVAGGCDATLGLDEARAAAVAFPNARLETFEQSGHLPMLEEPERFGRVLAEFCAGGG